MITVLLIEDDETLRSTTGAYLRQAGYRVVAVADGHQALRVYPECGADVVLLDLMLGGLDGLEVARRLRAMRRDLPLIMLTARAQVHERIQGLQAGADDYMTKPFSLHELDLRIRSLLRRSAPASAPVAGVLADGDLRIDLGARRAERDGVELPLTARELDLLCWFVQHPGVVHSRDRLIRDVWQWQAGDASTVTVHVRRLREKVEPDPAQPVRLVTVFGQGYRWDATPEPPMRHERASNE